MDSSVPEPGKRLGVKVTIKPYTGQPPYTCRASFIEDGTRKTRLIAVAI